MSSGSNVTNGSNGSNGPGGPDGSSQGAAGARLPEILRRPATPWVAGALALLVVVAAVLFAQGQDGEPSAAPSPSGSPSASAEPTLGPTAPTESGEPDPSPSPPVESEGPAETAEPTDPADPADPADPEPGGQDARPTAPPVGIEETAQPTPEVQARLSSIEAVDGKANVPGEVGGPSLRVTVSITNSTGSALDLTSAVVNLYYGEDLTPAIDLLEPGRRDFPATVAPDSEASGAFVFLVPEESRGEVRVELDLSTQATVVLFEGPVAV